MPRPDYCPATSRTSHAALTLSLVHGITITAANRLLKTGQITPVPVPSVRVIATQPAPRVASAASKAKAKPSGKN